MTPLSKPVVWDVICFLVTYAIGIGLLFRPNKFGYRRRWHPLDYVWVPLGGLTGICLLLLWWKTH
ncbi:MAG: hypothetical protein ABSG59_20290 [Verrucomicrobiota bacterium]|jgi:hypothetical protein